MLLDTAKAGEGRGTDDTLNCVSMFGTEEVKTQQWLGQLVLFFLLNILFHLRKLYLDYEEKNEI